MGADTPLTTLHHPTWGTCHLVRVEGTNWIVRFSNGKLYQFPPGTRSQFTSDGDIPLPASTTTAVADPPPPPETGLATVDHPQLGVGELLRIEITDWVVRFRSNGRTYRYPSSVRSKLTVLEDHTPDRRFTQAIKSSSSSSVESSVETSRAEVRVEPRTPIYIEIPNRPADGRAGSGDATAEKVAAAAAGASGAPPIDPVKASPHAARQRALRVIESLRNGLPPVHAEARELAVGIERISKAVENLLHDVKADGGRAVVMKGAYGQGKTFGLKLLEEMALEANFLVVRTEIDATENRLNKPHHIYGDLLRHLRVPGVKDHPLRALALKVSQRIREATTSIDSLDDLTWAGLQILMKETDCRPLSWLLSDPNVANKPDLLGLWACDPGVHVPTARRSHHIPGAPRDWPSFKAGTQGDFASFLLSGLGRIARSVGYEGLIIVMDEMEKWQDLNWNEQTQAGNLLGGLIWGATAELGKRSKSDEPAVINHSLVAGGFPFTTKPRNHVGIAIAMTPRGDDGPEKGWFRYGMLEIVNLPHLTEDRLVNYCVKLAPHYAAAVGLTPPTNGQIQPIAKRAVTLWKRNGQLTTRSGVQAAVMAFDAWRDKAELA